MRRPRAGHHLPAGCDTAGHKCLFRQKSTGLSLLPWNGTTYVTAKAFIVLKPYFEKLGRRSCVIRVANMVAVDEMGPDLSQVACSDWLTTHHAEHRGAASRPFTKVNLTWRLQSKQNTVSAGGVIRRGGRVISAVRIVSVPLDFSVGTGMYFPSFGVLRRCCRR